MICDNPNAISATPVKRCTVCSVEKPINQFYVRRSRGTHESRCKACKASVYRDWHAARKNVRSASAAQWYQDHKAERLEAMQQRRNAKRRATPVWLTDSQRAEIAALYADAKRLTAETGVEHHVDHVHPIGADNFMGLHVPWNLQILTKAENSAKGNRPPANEAHLFW